MKPLLLVLFVAVCTQAINFKRSHTDNFDIDVDEEWDNFKRQHKRSFYLSGHEKNRKAIFLDNLVTITKHNLDFERGLTSFKMGVNQFSDMTTEEFKSMMLSPIKISKRGSTFLPPMNAGELPNEIDWVKEGYVTPVKNQGHCGACWAFSTTGSIEGQHFRKTKQLVSLSEQNLVDCSIYYGNNGCQRGLMDIAYFYVYDNSGIDTEESYPYVGVEQKCKFNKDSVGATISSHADVKEGEEYLEEAIARVGPISVAINAGLDSFQHYKEGIYDEPGCDPKKMNHAVLAVGYGSEYGKDYYLVKNSWAKTWGDNGYIKMARNKNNQCGISSAASYPVI